MARFTKVYKLNVKEEAVFTDFLLGKLTTREAGKKLGITHQQVINASVSVAKQWVAEGKLKFIKNT